MQDNYRQFEKRKQDHIALALNDNNQASELNALDNIVLDHEALPDIDFADIDIQSQCLGKNKPNPFFVSSMTAGHQDALTINRNLMQACAQSDWSMGVGSQRRELTDKNAAKDWQILRKQFPNISLYSNLGIAQLINTPLPEVQRLTDVLEAAALIIHCNPLQEALQLEGTPQFKGCWQALTHLVTQISLPVVIKETGCGFSSSTLKRLNDIGVNAVDISGLGGTHWGRIEGQRAAEGSLHHTAAVCFRNWGIDTVSSIKNALSIKPTFEIWGSGGVRHGLDAAKLFALGASSVGFAKPMLNAALQNAASVHQLMMTIEYELKIAMFCTGSRLLAELREKICP